MPNALSITRTREEPRATLRMGEQEFAPGSIASSATWSGALREGGWSRWPGRVATVEPTSRRTGNSSGVGSSSVTAISAQRSTRTPGSAAPRLPMRLTTWGTATITGWRSWQRSAPGTTSNAQPPKRAPRERERPVSETESSVGPRSTPV